MEVADVEMDDVEMDDVEMDDVIVLVSVPVEVPWLCAEAPRSTVKVGVT